MRKMASQSSDSVPVPDNVAGKQIMDILVPGSTV